MDFSMNEMLDMQRQLQEKYKGNICMMMKQNMMF